LQQVIFTERGGTQGDHRGVRVESDRAGPVEQASEVPTDQGRQDGADGLPAIGEQIRAVPGVL